MQSKSEIRKHLRARRRALSPQVQRCAAAQLSRQLGKLPIFRKAKHIAAYWPNDGEISALPFLQLLQTQGKKLYLPEIQTNGRLIFKRFHFSRALRQNCYGIPEPVSKQQHAAHSMDIVLMPLVAFDRQGNRLGMGGGYYDKTFAFKQQFLWRKKPVLIGLAHYFQEVASLHSNRWDIPLGNIVTDRGCKKGHKSPCWKDPDNTII